MSEQIKKTDGCRLCEGAPWDDIRPESRIPLCSTHWTRWVIHALLTEAVPPCDAYDMSAGSVDWRTGMNRVVLPGWAYPTQEAKRLHYFAAEGEPSLCRRYFAGAVSLMEPLSSQHDLTESKCCVACWRKAPDLSIGGGE